MKEYNHDVLVKVEGLGKKFCKDLKTSLWYGIKDLAGAVLGNNKKLVLRPKEFWAVKDVSFELKRGECLGLIGHNGAGKSTLLKILNGLIKPDSGKVTIRGRVGALIELGAGFNPILTGRENIYNNGAILGFSRKEIDEKLEEIIAFAELEEFIDMPVQHFSSGMKVRLGFAIAAQMEPDVLIVDEVLAVGDLGFVLKCFKIMDQLLPNTAVVFVSHNMSLVIRICTKILLLSRGEVVYGGSDIPKAIDLYYNKLGESESKAIYDNGDLVLEEFKIINAPLENGIPQILWGDDLVLDLKFSVSKEIDLLNFFLIIVDKEQKLVATLRKNHADEKIVPNGGIIHFRVKHRELQLSKGVYSFTLGVQLEKSHEPVLRINNVLTFQVIHELETWEPFLLNASYENNYLKN